MPAEVRLSICICVTVFRSIRSRSLSVMPDIGKLRTDAGTVVLAVSLVEPVSVLARFDRRVSISCRACCSAGSVVMKLGIQDGGIPSAISSEAGEGSPGGRSSARLKNLNSGKRSEKLSAADTRSVAGNSPSSLVLDVIPGNCCSTCISNLDFAFRVAGVRRSPVSFPAVRSVAQQTRPPTARCAAA